VLFVEPIWLSLLIPTFFALVLLCASLAARHWGVAGFDKAPMLSAGAFVLAFAVGGPALVVILTALVLFTHWAALTIERASAREPRDRRHGAWSARTWLLVAVAVQLATIAVFARTRIVDGPLRDIGGTLVPFGLSYFGFHGISYVVDVYRRRAAAERSRLRLAQYLVLLPHIVGGPLTYEGVVRQLTRRLPSVSDYAYGVRRLLMGVWKVFVIAEFAGAQADAAFAGHAAGLTTFQAWIGLVGVTVQMYYAFSGYSDMGIGLARMLGVRLSENFRWPYVAESVREFWRRWHTGLSAWFRDYADASLDPDRVPPPSTGREALVVLLCAVWYGIGWTVIAWGAYHAAFVVLERYGLDAALKRLPAPMRHVYVIVVLMAGWVVLRSATLGDALLFFKALGGSAVPGVRVPPAVGVDTWLVLAAGAIGCAPLLPSIRRWTVAIDAMIVSLLMMLFAVGLFAWWCGRVIVMPILRGSSPRITRPRGGALS